MQDQNTEAVFSGPNFKARYKDGVYLVDFSATISSSRYPPDQHHLLAATSTDPHVTRSRRPSATMAAIDSVNTFGTYAECVLAGYVTLNDPPRPRHIPLCIKVIKSASMTLHCAV